ncbi:MAG TPA: beta-ketoacyl-ACP synthase III [Actinomycetota bacterium]|nr:beta-ketoacyl-ACP synthase III [Actinomycetota bacterium]
MGAAITGWGIALPERELHNAELARRLDVTEEWILERTGINSRHVAASTDSASSLSTEAGRAALTRAGLEASQLDMVIVATSTPDEQMPATASLVQHALGASGAGAFDLNAACSGFLVALAQAGALVTSGMAQRVLVCGADLLTRVLDYDDPRSCILFGDGAGAVVLESAPGIAFGPFRIVSDGSKEPLLRIPADDGHLRMKGREVYRHAIASMSAAVKEILVEAGLSVSDIDLLVAHQANARIVEAVALRLGLDPARAMLNISRLGNTSAASIPLALAEAVETGKLHDSDLVVLTAFGAGFVWGAGIVRWAAPVAPHADEELVVRSEISANTESDPARQIESQFRPRRSRGQGARSRAYLEVRERQATQPSVMQGRSNVTVISATGHWMARGAHD